LYFQNRNERGRGKDALLTRGRQEERKCSRRHPPATPPAITIALLHRVEGEILHLLWCVLRWLLCVFVWESIVFALWLFAHFRIWTCGNSVVFEVYYFCIFQHLLNCIIHLLFLLPPKFICCWAVMQFLCAKSGICSWQQQKCIWAQKWWFCDIVNFWFCIIMKKYSLTRNQTA